MSNRTLTSDTTWESLALTRFFLAMIVISAHVCMFGHSAVAAGVAQLSAFTAVVCFLIVSGYSIAHSVHKRTDGFYTRRVLRVYPLYAMSIIVPVAVQAMRGHLLPHQATNAFQNLFFLQAFTADPAFLNQVVWTLAIEVICYAAAPMLVRMSTRQLLTLAVLSGLAYVSYPLLSQLKVKTPYYAFLPYGGGVLMLGWAWMAGFIYYRHRDQKSAGLVLALSVFGTMAVNGMFCQTFSNLTIGITIASLTFGRNLKLSMPVRKLATFAGDVSFPLYLLHFPLFYLMSGVVHVHSVGVLVGSALVTAAVGIFIDNQMKRPAQVIVNLSVAAGQACVRTTAAAVNAATYFIAGGSADADGPSTMTTPMATQMAA